MATETLLGGKASGTAQPFRYAPAGGEAPTAGNQEALVQQAFQRGVAEGEARARAAFEKTVNDLRNQIADALRQFGQERNGYFGRVETELVRLSLSIARKILHREAQIDPFALTGMVRVALDTLGTGTRVCLRVHPDEVKLWQDYFKQTKDLQTLPEIAADPSLGAGQCTLETDLGSTQISVETQLKEIEQGFVDLLDHRPRVQE